MSKGVIAEDSLKQSLQDVTPASGFVVGLILSQRCSQRDYVVLLPAFQNSQPQQIPFFKSLQEVNVKSVILFCKQVHAFLPGGVTISGIFSTSCQDVGVLEPSQSSKLQSFVTSLFSKLDPLLFTSTAIPDKLVMHYNTSTDKITCKSVNVMDTKWYLNNTEWKFQSVPWQRVESRFGFDLTCPLHENNGVTNLKSSLAELLKVKCSEIKSTHCLLDGEIHDLNTPLESITDAHVMAQLLLPCSEDVNAAVKYVNCSGDLVMTGHVYSCVYVHPKSSVGDIISALKEDIVRSLHTRFELHTDALIEEEGGSPEERVVQHDLPRRILIPVPYSKLMLSNYLFPGEAAKDSLTSIKQLLGFDVDVNNIEEDVEQETDTELLLPSEELVYTPSTQPEPDQSFMTLYTALAVGVLFLALCTTLLLMKEEEEEQI